METMEFLLILEDLEDFIHAREFEKHHHLLGDVAQVKLSPARTDGFEGNNKSAQARTVNKGDISTIQQESLSPSLNQLTNRLAKFLSLGATKDPRKLDHFGSVGHSRRMEKGSPLVYSLFSQGFLRRSVACYGGRGFPYGKLGAV